MHSICKKPPKIKITADYLTLQQDDAHYATAQHNTKENDTQQALFLVADLGFNFGKIPIVERIVFEEAKANHRKILGSHTLPCGAVVPRINLYAS